MAVGLLIAGLPEHPAPEPVATIVESYGEVQSRTGALPDSDDLAPGGLLRTGRDSGVRLHLADGTDLRLDSESTLEWLENPSRGSLDRPSVRLSSGALYFRSPPSDGQPLGVATPFGDLINAGTEYELRLDARGLELAVAEGSVRVRPSTGGDLRVRAGEHVRVHSDGTLGTPRALETDRTRLDWTLQLGRMFAVDGRTIEDFVRWVAEERGLEVRWLIDEGARTTRLRGDLIWQDPRAALVPTLRMAGLEARIDKRLLIVGVPSGTEDR